MYSSKRRYLVHLAVDQHALAVVGLEDFATENFLPKRLLDLLEVEVVHHQFALVGEFEAGNREMPAEPGRRFRREIPAATVVRHGKWIGLAFLGPGLEVADCLIAIVADARQLKIQRFTPGIGAGPFSQ